MGIKEDTLVASDRYGEQCSVKILKLMLLKIMYVDGIEYWFCVLQHSV
jgi:hypothetical protein